MPFPWLCGGPDLVDAETGLMDIVVPAAPPSPDWTGFMVASVAILAVAGLVIYQLGSRRLRARRRLARLQRQLRAGSLAPRAAAFQTAALLRAGRQHNLSASLSANQRRTDPRRWQQFMDQLTRLRYARTPPSVDQALAAIGEARYWLRPWI